MSVTPPPLDPLVTLVSTDLAEDVPARHVDARLDVGMAFQLVVHDVIKNAQLPGVEAEKEGAELPETSAHALGVGRQVVGTQRTHLQHGEKVGVLLQN